MSALYKMTYGGGVGFGHGAIFIGNGQVLGIDIGDIWYEGKYWEENGQVRMQANMTAKSPDAVLVTGRHLSAGETIPIDATWPLDMEPDELHQISVAGRPVNVTLEKIGDIG